MEKKPSIGAFWKKVSGSLTEYYSGNITIDGKKIYLVMFNNTAKKNEKEPDLRMFISEPIPKTGESYAVKKIKEEVPEDVPF